ncbi:MAG: hypothetical protein NZ108_06355, partial [Bacteroidia bacterium]|nr:hypothetical protein [Bacteroidia bacterium]
KGHVLTGPTPGIPGAGIADLNTVRYWETSKVYGNITSLNLKATWGSDDGVSSISEVRLGHSLTPTGTYNSVGVSAVLGSPSGGVITSNPINRLGYYSLGKNKGNQAEIQVLLQGPYSVSGDSMACKLNGILASNQLLDSMFHYNGVSPVFVPGGEIVMAPGFSVPPLAVDVVKLVLRDSNTPSYTLIDSTYGWLLNDGTITDFSEPGSFPKFPKATAGDYYVVIYHRNHLPVMTAVPIDISPTPSLFDMTILSNVHDEGALLKNGRAMMFAGNAVDNFTSDDAYEVNASDLNAVGLVNGNIEGKYVREDVNLDGNVNGTDYNIVSIGQDLLYYTTVP